MVWKINNTIPGVCWGDHEGVGAAEGGHHHAEGHRSDDAHQTNSGTGFKKNNPIGVNVKSTLCFVVIDRYEER